MSVTVTSPSDDHPPDNTPTDSDRPRPPSSREHTLKVPTDPPEPPDTLRLHSLPEQAQKALVQPGRPLSPHPLPPPSILMPVEPAVQNIIKRTRKEEAAGEGISKAKGKERQGKDKELSGSTWAESADFAYEYVPVVQRREGRGNM